MYATTTRVKHTATAEPRGDGTFLVLCPYGCPLGTSADAKDEVAAARRIRLHELATEPLTK